MAKHRSLNEIAAIVKAIDKQRTKRVPVDDCSQALGIAEQTYYCWHCATLFEVADVTRR